MIDCHMSDDTRPQPVEMLKAAMEEMNLNSDTMWE